MRRSLLGGLAALSFLLTGCGGDDDSGSGGNGADGADEETTTTEPPGGVRLFDGEERVAVGERIEYTAAGDDGELAVAVTVTGFETGAIEDLTSVGFDVGDDGEVPVYVRYTLEKVGPEPVSGVGEWSMVAYGNDPAKAYSAAVLIGDVPACDWEELPADAPAGTTLEQCTVVLVDEGDEVSGVRTYTAEQLAVSWFLDA